MIRLHRLKGKEFLLNHHLIELIEAGADTVIVLTNDHRYIVEESAGEIIELIHDFENKNIAGRVRVPDDT